MQSYETGRSAYDPPPPGDVHRQVRFLVFLFEGNSSVNQKLEIGDEARAGRRRDMKTGR